MTLASITLPADGTYRIQVQAAPGHASSIGHYIVTSFDSTPNVAPLEFNQQVVGEIENPYQLDRWTFVGLPGEQVRFDLIGGTASTLRFSLSGPAGFTGFTDTTASSDLIDLNVAGNYTLTVHDSGDAGDAYAFRLDQTAQTALAPGSTYNGIFIGSGQAQLFTVDVPQAQQFLVSLKDSSTADHIELYAQLGAPPTRSDHQYAATAPGSVDQQLLVPMAAPGIWYILVYAEAVAAAPQDYTLTPSATPVSLTAVFPDHIGNAEDAVLTLAGGGFDSTTTAALMTSGGKAYQANRVQLELPTHMSATFSAGSVPAGVYWVVVTRGDGTSSTLKNAFTMDDGGLFHFHANLVVPELTGLSRGGHALPAIHQHGRSGHAGSDPRGDDLPDPCLHSTLWHQHSDYGPEGAVDTGPLAGQARALDIDRARWLQQHRRDPGQRRDAGRARAGRVDPGPDLLRRLATALGSRPSGLRSRADDRRHHGHHADLLVRYSRPIPRPSDISPAAWDAMVPNLAAQVGNTWGGFVQRLDADASYLGHLGENVTDLSQLWSFEVQQANGFSPVSDLSSATDAQVPMFGLALTVDRAFPNSINSRYQMGPFGLGWEWTDGWQRVVSVDSSGTVTITDSDGRQRFFQPDGRGGYFDEPGDCCTLLSDGGGRFTLQEKDGNITDFGPDGRVTDIKDTNGNTVSAVYSGGLLIDLDASTGQSLTFTYNAAGRITAITDSTGRTTNYTYDASNQFLLSVTDFTGRTTSYTYDTSGAPATRNALLSAQNPDRTIDNFRYDAQGHLSETFLTNATMPGVDMTPVTYASGPFGDVSATDANGGTTQYSFDARGLLVKFQDPLGNVTHLLYDTNFNLVQVIDAAGQVTTNSYDQNRNLIRTTSPDGSVVAYTYSGPFHGLTSYTDPDGNTTSYAYDDRGNQLSITYADNSEEQFSYDPLGNLTDTINRRGQWASTMLTNMSMGQLVREDFADGTDNEYAYDSTRQ